MPCDIDNDQDNLEVHIDVLSKISHGSIIPSCIKATSQYILRTSMPMIAGWNDHVKPYKEQSVFWHIIWQDNGCPRHGIIYDIKCKTQTKYKQVIKTTKRDQAILRYDKMACAVKCRDKSDLCDNENFTIFRNKYNDWYNSVYYNSHDMKSVLNELDCNNQWLP
jgi:hypothetical protein